jgi:predicted transposase YdaD
MPNMSNYDRVVWEEGQIDGLAKGRVEGRVEGLQDTLMELAEHRFGPGALLLRERIEAIQNEAELRSLARSILSVSSLADFSQQLPISLPG